MNKTNLSITESQTLIFRNQPSKCTEIEWACIVYVCLSERTSQNTVFNLLNVCAHFQSSAQLIDKLCSIFIEQKKEQATTLKSPSIAICSAYIICMHCILWWCCCWCCQDTIVYSLSLYYEQTDICLSCRMMMKGATISL